jgi:hypothetical protein
MLKKYGGKQSKLLTSLIQQEKGYLGQLPRILNPVDVQRMVFLPGGEGPCWMTAEQWQSTRFDVEIQGKTMKKKLTKEELTQKLAGKGIIAQGNIMNMKQLCTQQGIPVEIEVKKCSKVGKGALKECFKSCVSQVFLMWITWNNNHWWAKGCLRNLQHHSSLKYLLGNCTDFEEVESMLQSIGSALGVTIDWMPKCHCELAGEGIEYSSNIVGGALRMHTGWCLSVKKGRKKHFGK